MREDAEEQCAEYGQITGFAIDEQQKTVMIRYSTALEALRCKNALDGKLFDGRRISVKLSKDEYVRHWLRVSWLDPAETGLGGKIANYKRNGKSWWSFQWLPCSDRTRGSSFQITTQLRRFLLVCWIRFATIVETWKRNDLLRYRHSFSYLRLFHEGSYSCRWVWNSSPPLYFYESKTPCRVLQSVLFLDLDMTF